MPAITYTELVTHHYQAEIEQRQTEDTCAVSSAMSSYILAQGSLHQEQAH